MQPITTKAEITKHLKVHEQAAILFYKVGATHSECAYQALSKLSSIDEIPLYCINVAEADPIHRTLGITSVPTLAMIKHGKTEQLIKGCHKPEILAQLLKKSSGDASHHSSGHRVIVYSTPSCPHCTSMKNYLKQLQVPFRDINIAADAQKAQDLVQRTGQQGVPQAQINGQWVLGFDKAKIDQLLR